MAIAVRTLHPRGAFSLPATAGFLRAFTPAGRATSGEGGELRLAVVPDGESRVGAAAIAQRRGDGGVVLTICGAAPPDAVAAQLSRLLGLDLDADGFAELGRRDPVVGGLQARLAGLRPAGFCSPWEAAVWFVLTQRASMRQAAAVKARMTECLGETVEVAGAALAAFPGPDRLVELDAFPGVPARKVGWLRGIARAALDGRLDGTGLRAMPVAAALASLRELPGVGAFTAEGILLRGAGAPDVLPTAEPRLRDAVRRAYDLPGPPDDVVLAELAAGWRPFRSWVAVMLRADLERAG